MTGNHPHWRRFRNALLQAVLVLLVLQGIHLFQTLDTVSGPAPAIVATTLDGRTLRLADYHGRPVLVHFWASWCPVCRLQEDVITAIDRDWPVISIAIDTDAAALREHLDRRGPGPAVIHDPLGELARRYGVDGVPTSFVVDADGIIRFTEVGYTTAAGLRIRLTLAKWKYGTDQ